MQAVERTSSNLEESWLRMQLHWLRRREFISLVVGAAGWPLTGRAHRPEISSGADYVLHIGQVGESRSITEIIKALASA
jgi:hypothetical protein